MASQKNTANMKAVGLLITISLVAGNMLKVWDFYGNGFSKSGEDNFDFVQLDNDVGRDLPSKFTICLSHFQAKFSENKMLQFLGQDGQPWFYFYINSFNQDEIGTIIFWMELEGEFLNFGTLEGMLLNFVLHFLLSS